jgi:hypothetical protein
MFNQNNQLPQEWTYFCHHEAIGQACDCYENIPADVDNAADSFFWNE